jgi:hypothetical protein
MLLIHLIMCNLMMPYNKQINAQMDTNVVEWRFCVQPGINDLLSRRVGSFGQ